MITPAAMPSTATPSAVPAMPAWTIAPSVPVMPVTMMTPVAAIQCRTDGDAGDERNADHGCVTAEVAAITAFADGEVAR